MRIGRPWHLTCRKGPLAIRNASIPELNLQGNQITSVDIRALVDDNMEAVKTLTTLSLLYNTVRSEGVKFWPMLWGETPCPPSDDSIYALAV
jgi:hypothetical protein